MYPLQLHFKDESAVGWDAVGDSLGPVGELGWDDDEPVARFLHSQHSLLPALLPNTDGQIETQLRRTEETWPGAGKAPGHMVPADLTLVHILFSISLYSETRSLSEIRLLTGPKSSLCFIISVNQKALF